MRSTLWLVALLLAGCSQRQPSGEPPASTYDAREEPTAPGVDVTAAPGVAFNYRYAFRLPSTRIAQVQEQHAQACEKLGLDKCRITGMRYRLVNQTDIQAMLALRLDPGIARQFGKEATDAVKQSEGMLVDQEITGEDVGTQIASASRSESALTAELDKVDAELRSMSARDPHRGEVARRADDLRQQLRSLAESKAQGQQALAGTPMVFNYGSGTVVPGFDVRSPLKEALARSADNFIDGFATILVILITVIPWALLLALLILLYRLARRRWGWTVPSLPDGQSDADRA